MIDNPSDFIFVTDVQYWRMVNDNIQFYSQHKKFYANKDYLNSFIAHKNNMSIDNNVFHSCALPPHFAFKNLDKRYPQAGLTRGSKEAFSKKNQAILDIQEKYKNGVL